jgi:hypothetical protein
MELNPYARFLPQDEDPLEVLAGTPARLHALLDLQTSAVTDRPVAPGKWSPRQIVAHLADCELVFAFRLRQTLAETEPTLQPFHQDRWAARYEAYNLAAALAVFEATRTWNLRLIEAATPDDKTRGVTHPERGTMTFQTIVETMAGHDRNHLRQLEKL